MPVFNTERPADANIALTEAVKLAKIRKENAKRLQDSYVLETQTSSLQSTLKSIDEEACKTNCVSYELEKQQRLIHDKRIKERLVLLKPKLIKDGCEQCFENMIFQLIYESYWLDNSVKESTIPQMFEAYKNTVNLLESAGIKPVPESKQNQFIRNIKDIATQVATEAATRITEDAIANKDDCTPEDIDSINFKLSDPETLELDNNLSELSPDDITTLVKQKVVQVVQDEKEAGKRKAELFDEVKDETTDPDDAENTDDETTTEESASFESMARIGKLRKLNTRLGSSLFECINMNTLHNVESHATLEGLHVSSEKDVMDAAFMEAMLTYTILETLQTIGLYEFNELDVSNLQKEYMKLK